MTHVALGSGQGSLSRIRHSSLSVFVTLKALERSFMSLVVSAVGYLEGYALEGVASSLGSVGPTASCSLLFVPYQGNLRCNNNTPSVFPAISSPTLGDRKRQVRESLLPFPPLFNAGQRSGVGSDFTTCFDDSLSHGSFSKEILAFRILNETYSHDVALRVITLLLASGISIPRKTVVGLLDRLAKRNKGAACTIAFLLEAELSLTGHIFALGAGPSARRPQFSLLRNVVDSDNFVDTTVQPMCPRKTKAMRLSRLQNVRNRRK